MASAGSPRLLSKVPQPFAVRNWTGRRWQRWQRWGTRLLAAAPLIALALWAQHRGFVNPGLALLEHRAHQVTQGGADLRGMRYGYPPLPVMLAIILPGGTLALSITACVFSGFILQYLAERLLRRLPLLTSLALLAAFVAVPAMWYASSQLLAADASLAFLAIALGAFIRFAVHGETEGGFVAGIALAVSYCFDPGAILYALVMCAFAPLISHVRYRSDPAATASIAGVLLFPLAATALSWFFLVWKFSGTFPGSLSYASEARLFDFPSGVWGGLARAAGTAVVDLAHAPLYLLAGFVLFRRPMAILGFVLPVVGLTAGLWLGFAYSQITAFFMFTILALVTISDTASKRDSWVLAGMACVQLAVAIAWPPSSVGFTAWLHAVM